MLQPMTPPPMMTTWARLGRSLLVVASTSGTLRLPAPAAVLVAGPGLWS